MSKIYGSLSFSEALLIRVTLGIDHIINFIKVTFLDFNLELQKRKKNREILLNCEKVESVASNGSEAA